MAASVLVDAGFLVALLSRRDTHHAWAVAQARHAPPPWLTCDAVLSETLYLVGTSGREAVLALLRREAVVPAFSLREHADAVSRLLEKYRDVPASLADGCLVRMTEILSDPLLLTTDQGFRVYRRHGRQVIPVAMPVMT